LSQNANKKASEQGEKAFLLRPAVPGRLFSVVKVISWIELALFAALLFFWIAPGYEHETFIFGLSHGIGFCILAAIVLIACLAREAPYPLLAATMTPVGPVGSVIGIALIERKGWGIEPPIEPAGSAAKSAKERKT
jgi:general stress protein CsbA